MRANFDLLLAISVITLTATQAGEASGWVINSERDRITDKTETWAEVGAKPDAARKIDGKVLLICSRELARYIVHLRLNPRLNPGRLGFRYRVDQREQKIRLDQVGAGGGPIFFVEPSELRGAKQLRVELYPTKVDPIFFDFDVSGFEQAMAAIPCR